MNAELKKIIETAWEKQVDLRHKTTSRMAIGQIKIGAENAHKGYTYEELRKVSDLVMDPQDWKKPMVVKADHRMVDVIIAAFEFFHADTPEIGGIEHITGRVVLYSHGYQAY